MLTIRTPVGREAARLHVFSIVIGDWFGLPWHHEPQTRTDVSISIAGDSRELRLPDVLFSTPEAVCLSQASLHDESPKTFNVNYMDARCAVIDPLLPVLYGDEHLRISRESETVRLPIDIFGSIFYLLTGLSELNPKHADEHGRFPGQKSVLYQSGIIDRPLADEYSEILWCSLSTLWPSLKRRSIPSNIFLSCDVDEPFDCTVSALSPFIRAVAGDVLKRHSFKEVWLRGNRYIRNRFKDYSYDRCYTFNEYINLCREYNRQATFYFIPSSKNPNNGCYSVLEPRVHELFRKLSAAGHEIGMHNCYEAFRDFEGTLNNRNHMVSALSKAGVEQDLKGNRQHYLRWDSAVTPAVLDAAGFEYDTTGGFADVAGFRFGSAREYAMWDWSNGRSLKLRQRPLIVMDCTITDYMGLGRGHEAATKIQLLRQRSMKLGGNFTVLWHNTSLRSPDDYSLLRAAIE